MIYTNDPDVTNSPLIAWDNLVTKGTLEAQTGGSAAGFPLSGLQNGYTTDPWRPNTMPSNLVLTLPAPAPASVLAFAAHDMHTQGVTVRLDRWVTDAWQEVREVTPESDAPFMVSFPVADASQWRAVFTGDNTFRLGVMHLSRGLVFPSGTRIQPPHVPLHRVSEIELIGGSESGTGEFLQADTMRTGGRANIDFSVQLPDLMLSDSFEGFRQHFNKGRPFFIACFPRYEAKDMGYVWRGGPSILTPYQDAVFMALDMEVAVYVG